MFHCQYDILSFTFIYLNTEEPFRDPHLDNLLPFCKSQVLVTSTHHVQEQTTFIMIYWHMLKWKLQDLNIETRLQDHSGLKPQNQAMYKPWDYVNVQSFNLFTV